MLTVWSVATGQEQAQINLTNCSDLLAVKFFIQSNSFACVSKTGVHLQVYGQILDGASQKSVWSQVHGIAIQPVFLKQKQYFKFKTRFYFFRDCQNQYRYHLMIRIWL